MNSAKPSQPTSISESTKFTLSVVVSIVGAALLCGVVYSRVQALEDRQDRFGSAFKDLRDKNDARWEEVHRSMIQISEDVGKIKGRLKIE